MLTKDCIQYITFFLEYKDILSFVQTNKKTRDSLDNEFWKRYLKEKCNYEYNFKLDEIQNIRHYYRFFPLDTSQPILFCLYNKIVDKQYLGLFNFLIDTEKRIPLDCFWENVSKFPVVYQNYFYRHIINVSKQKDSSLWNEYSLSTMLTSKNYEITELFLTTTINLPELTELLFSNKSHLTESLMWINQHFVPKNVIAAVKEIILTKKSYISTKYAFVNSYFSQSSFIDTSVKYEKSRALHKNLQKCATKETKRYWKLWEKCKLLLLLFHKHTSKKELVEVILVRWKEFLLIYTGFKKPIDPEEELCGHSLNEMWTNLGSIFLRHHEEWTYGHLWYLIEKDLIFNFW
jgi:hypothetical protein